jgi:DNA-binding MarR family transcriptional regulator
MPSPTKTDHALLANELRVVLGRLVRRLRAEKQPLPLTQTSVLARLDRDGPRSASELAAAELMRPQSMAQMLAELEEQQMILRTPDPTDGRRALVALTPRGRATLAECRLQREGWLAGALTQLSASELKALSDALPALRRLAEG